MIFDIAKKRAELTPERSAVWWDGRWTTYKELDDRATRLAARLAEADVVRGDRVSILALNHMAHLDLILATAKLGFIYTPFNYRLSEHEQRKIADYVRPKIMFFDAENAVAAEATGVEGVGLEHYETWLAAAPSPPPAPELSGEDAQMMLFTGGTTGVPKGAVQPYRQGFCNAVNTAFSWGLRDDDCAVQATPCFHAAVNALTVPLLHLGARVVLQRAFKPGEYLELVSSEACTLLFMVPTMFKSLAEHPDFPTADFQHVRWAISGGAPCPEPVRTAFLRRGIRFKQGYGLTEAGVNCFAISLDDAEARPASVGKPVLHAEAVLRDEQGEAVTQGEVGELTLRGPHLFKGYFERPKATAEVLRDGWLYTGDLARADEDGFFTIVGRRKEMFISGGENVFPVEVETALYEHSAVSECAVVGVSDERWGEVGLAIIVLFEGEAVTEEEVRGFLKAHLASYKVPKHIRFVDALPKSGAGKILKSDLAAAFKETHATF